MQTIDDVMRNLMGRCTLAIGLELTGCHARVVANTGMGAAPILAGSLSVQVETHFRQRECPCMNIFSCIDPAPGDIQKFLLLRLREEN